MPAIVGALELDDDQRALAVESQEIDASPRVLEQSILLRHHKEVITEDVDPLTELALQILPFPDLFGGKAGAIDSFQARGTVTVKRHGCRSGPQPARAALRDQRE